LGQAHSLGPSLEAWIHDVSSQTGCFNSIRPKPAMYSGTAW
jgi:hypothetical protein